MSIFTGVIVYLLLFWTVLFAVLPFGNHWDEGEEARGEHFAGAPHILDMKRKFLITAVVSAFFWIVIFTLIQLGVVDFYAIAERMSAEDKS